MSVNDWKVLTILSKGWKALGASEISRRTKLSKSTVYRCLMSLSENGHVLNGDRVWWARHRGSR